MANFINKYLGEKSRKSFIPKKYKELSDDWKKFFKENGEGLYYSNLQSSDNNFVSKAIGKFSGGLTHSIAILYDENLKSRFDTFDWLKIKNSFERYYGHTKDLDISIKVLVLASADSGYMNFFDFSTYQKRLQCIRKAPLSIRRQNKVIDFLASIEAAYYDRTGLVFFYLIKFFRFFGFLDDPESYWCSENIYDAFKKANFRIADCDNPSPLDNQRYNKNLIKFNNLTVKI